MGVPTSDPVLLLDAAATLPNPPVEWAYVGDDGIPPLSKELDLEVWADAASDLTSLELLGAVPKAKTLADDDVDSVDDATDQLTVTGHAYKDGDGPVQLTTTDTLPGGLTASTDYWIEVVDANTIKLYASLEDFLSGADAVDITSGGTGTHTIVDTADTARLRWMSFGLLGQAADGAVSLADDQDGYTVRIAHRPPVKAYALAGSATAAVSAALRYYSGR